MKLNWLSTAVPAESRVQIPAELLVTEVQVEIRSIPDCAVTVTAGVSEKAGLNVRVKKPVGPFVTVKP